MGHVLRCLCATNVGPSVVAMVMEMTDNLLNTEMNDDEVEMMEQDSRLVKTIWLR